MKKLTTLKIISTIINDLAREEYFHKLVKETDQEDLEIDEDFEELFSFNPLDDINDFETDQNELLKKEALASGLEKYSKVVVIVGSFSSGKTSLINVITGLSLPTDTIENTKTIVEISWSNEEQLILYYTGQEPNIEPFSSERISYLVNKNSGLNEETKGTKNELIKLRVCFPIKNISEDTLIVDTPGVNGLEYSEQFEIVTLPYIKQVPKDKMKVIWLQSLERAQPSSNEMGIIRQLLLYGNSKSFIGTKYDYFLTKSNWEELQDLYTSPVYEINDGQKKSIYEMFNSTLFIMYTRPDQTFIRPLNGKEEYSKFSKDLLEEWFGIKLNEAKELYQNLVQRLSNAFEEKVLINIDEFRERIYAWPKNISENLEIQSSFSRTIYDIVKKAYDFDENNDHIIQEVKLQLNENIINEAAQEIMEVLKNEYNKHIDSDLDILKSKASQLSVEIRDELVLFDLFNKISLRLFLINSQNNLEKKIASQFRKTKQNLLNISNPNPKDASLVKSRFFIPLRFSFILSWLEEYYLHNLTQLVKTIYRRVNDKHLNND